MVNPNEGTRNVPYYPEQPIPPPHGLRDLLAVPGVALTF